jgi:hypothetical protein
VHILATSRAIVDVGGWHLEFDGRVDSGNCARCDGPIADEMRDAAERLAWAASAERKMAEDDNLPAIVDAVCCSRLMMLPQYAVPTTPSAANGECHHAAIKAGENYKVKMAKLQSKLQNKPLQGSCA